MTKILPPGGVIGILGGGQLGRMLSLSAARLGLKTHIYCDEADSPAFEVASAFTCAPYEDQTALARFADACDAVTYEFENVPAETAAFVAARCALRPNEKALALTQDRLVEKDFVSSLRLLTPPYKAISSREDALSVKGKAVIKTRRFGYDGKGQAMIDGGEEAAAAFERLGSVPCIAEGFVDFAYEASVIAARGVNGDFAAYDPPHNVHKNHILSTSTVPSPLSANAVEDAVRIARSIAEGLDYIGVFAVELFVTRDGALIVNEIAPRVHNSGHWTMDACLVSQFEQHIRAVAGWPLGNPARHSDAMMLNLIGEDAADWQGLAQNGGALHLYGKREIRVGRKMGHVNFLAPKK
jgi:5-(carboxyamino)imidazole ribonucleotide synthase